ncbi:MAG TPA: restriction endonuclease, partial [Rhodoferax sp.]
MASRSRRTRQRKNSPTIKEMGQKATVLGLFFLILSFFLGHSIMGQMMGAALRVPGWLFLMFGALAWGASVLMEKSSSAQGRPWPMAQPKWQEKRPMRASAPNSSTHVEAAAPRATSENTAPPRPEPTPEARDARARSTHWSPAVFVAIEWRRFEAVCEKLFGQAGFETCSQSHGADGGVDIWLHSRNAEGPVAVVQCKHWQGKSVGVKEVREFLGVMASHKLARGTYATTTTYTADAQQFAKDNGINALDGKGLLTLIAKRTPEQQQALLDIAFEGEYWRPTCASCGIKMVERKPAKGGAG